MPSITGYMIKLNINLVIKTWFEELNLQKTIAVETNIPTIENKFIRMDLFGVVMNSPFKLSHKDKIIATIIT
jgi:hypothetical protein